MLVHIKKLFVSCMLIVLIGTIFAGCGNNQKEQMQDEKNTNNDNVDVKSKGENQELRMLISSIMRLERSENPINKEQAEQLISILKDIKEKETIEKEYANKQINAINFILTDKQKEALNKKPENIQGERPQGQDMSKLRPDMMEDNNLRTNGARNFGNLKGICERTIELLSTK